MTASGPARRNRMALPVAFGLLAASLIAAVVMALAGVPVVSVAELPWLTVPIAGIVAVRLAGARPGVTAHRDAVLFWANLALASVAVWISPAFGLYLFIGYVEAARMGSRVQRIAGMVGTALVIALAQVGGPRSILFTPIIYGAFVAVNLGITGLMVLLDRQREQLFADLTRANDQLRDEQARSAVLRDQLVAQAREAGIAEERARLSREIHDTVAQDLVAIIAQLDAASASADEAERSRRLVLVDAAAREALAEARRAVRALASPRLDEADLPLALDDLLGQWRESTGLDGELRVVGPAASSTNADVLLRIAQEALANITRHARARRGDVVLSYTDTAAQLEVTDDGVGFDPVAVTDGYGVRGMRARLAAVGGELDVRSAPGDGTSVIARVPLEEGSP